MPTFFGRLTPFEKIAVAFLGVLAIVMAYQIGRAFYLEHSQALPETGGLYVEADSGRLDPLNPLFIHYGSLSHDLALLVFSGLTRYDPATQEIVPDLATFKTSGDGKNYTFALRENALWHDGQPVTADDVLFTYQSLLQNPALKGPLLNINDYGGMKVSKLDERTVQFSLEKADSFFLAKTLVGLLPEHLLAAVAPGELSQSPFNQAPVGSGPYRFVSMAPVENRLEVTLQSFDRYYGAPPHIPTLQFRIYSTPEEAFAARGEVDGLRTVSEEAASSIPQGKNLNLIRYTLPQYVAVFLNAESPILKNKTVRLGLQLGTDKTPIAQALGQSRTLDTPLLEIDQRNWVYQYSVSKANGALHETEWELPADAKPEPAPPAEKTVADPNDTSAVTFINNPNGGHDWQTTDLKTTLSGTAPANTKAVFIDDYELKKFVPGDRGWSYVASADLGNLKPGPNVFRLHAVDFDGKKKELDAITIVQGTADEFNTKELEKIRQENADAQPLPTRINKKGDLLSLRLIVPEQPAAYGTVAALLAEQWKKMGVQLAIETLPSDSFQERMAQRDYDLLIFGQNLGYNLDAYPYWHSSQAKEGGYNLSQFKNFAVDSLLEKARLESDLKLRQKTLEDIQSIMSKEVPAIFLYSPTYYSALSSKIQNATFEHLATLSDRFSRISDWYAEYHRSLVKGTTPLTFISWLGKQF